MVCPLTYGIHTFGRNLYSSAFTPSRDSTSWTHVSFSSTAYDYDGTSTITLLDPWFGHFDSNGDVVVDHAVSTAYISGVAYRGLNYNSSGNTAIYSGIKIFKNNTELKSIAGSSSTANPSFRRFETSFAVGDIIKIQSKVNNTKQGYVRVGFTITCEGYT